ncbi:MAG: hypothetical protein HC862_17635 [Scytonema sp. RU_4_4]|nr:hypothetical protein [Scytonema sp. RU_4_4]NJR75400.1 hypothetical protein [Scytonema sp. CRU_2_7]
MEIGSSLSPISRFSLPLNIITNPPAGVKEESALNQNVRRSRAVGGGSEVLIAVGVSSTD